MEFGQDQCKPKGKNLLKDPKFSTVFKPRAKRKRTAAEHRAGEPFEYEVNEAELLIRKTGKEPWFIMTQIVPGDDIKGKTVLFSADIKLNMQPPKATQSLKTGGGLTLTAMVNGKPSLRSILEHEPHMGRSDWQTVKVKMELPKNLEFLRLGFLHQADGELSARNPSLRRLPNSDCAL
jgi:hypothetical protein